MIRRFDMPRLCLLAALAWPLPCLAQAPAGASRSSPQAQARFEQGVAAFGEGRFRDAVELFKEADRLSPSPLLSFNIAKVYERMGDSRSALASYRDYLRRLPQAENRVDVQARIGQLEQALKAAGVQQLTVLSTPAGATVLVDNVSRGVSPWTGELGPGRHLLSLRLDGYRDTVRELDLPSDHAIDVSVTLERSARSQAPPPPVPAVSERDPRATPKAAPVANPPPAEVVPEDPPPVPRWWTWAMFGASAAAFAGAGVFELSRASLEDEAKKSAVQLDAQSKLDDIESRQTAARVFLGVGVVAALAGGVSLFFDVRHANEAPTDIAFGCDPSGCTLAAGGRF